MEEFLKIREVDPVMRNVSSLDVPASTTIPRGGGVEGGSIVSSVGGGCIVSDVGGSASSVGDVTNGVGGSASCVGCDAA